MTTRSRRKTSIWATDRLQEVIGPAGEDQDVSVSGRVTQIADRYGEILAKTQITTRFTEAELNLIRDSLTGVIHEPASTIRGVHVGVEDSIRFEALDKKWHVNGEALLTKLRALAYHEEVALVEAVEQWRRVGRNA